MGRGGEELMERKRRGPWRGGAWRGVPGGEGHGENLERWSAAVSKGQEYGAHWEAELRKGKEVTQAPPSSQGPL